MLDVELKGTPEHAAVKNDPKLEAQEAQTEAQTERGTQLGAQEVIPRITDDFTRNLVLD
jgi:hypothetical protein